MRVGSTEVSLSCPILTKVGVPLQSSVKAQKLIFMKTFQVYIGKDKRTIRLTFIYASRVYESPKTYKATTTFSLPFHWRVVCTADTGELVQRTVVC
jgi:hypothetical protein